MISGRRQNDSDTVIRIEDLSKLYRLGQVGSTTLGEDLTRWWYRIRGKGDPFAIVGQTNRRETESESDYVWALKDINLEVKRGERLGIIGANGAGKSTLLKILSKVTGPTTGSLKIRGRLASLLEVGTGFHPEMTGRENIFMNGAILGMTRHEIKRKLDDIVDFAGVARYLDTPVKRYSSGMKVRLGFAVAAHLEPDILVVDEVLAVGDAEFQKRAIGKMEEVSEGEGRTILFVSHNMTAVRRLCSRTIQFSHGQLSRDGDSSLVVEDYLRSVVSAQPVSPCNGDLTNASRKPEHGQLVRFQKCHIRLPGGRCSECLSFGQSFSVELELLAFRDVQDLCFVVGIDSSDGVRVATAASEDSSPAASIPANHRIRCLVDFDAIPLIPGVYTVTVGCRSGRVALDRVENAACIEIIDSPADGFRLESRVHGLLRPRLCWQFELATA